jgi:hypothetical protein
MIILDDKLKEHMEKKNLTAVRVSIEIITGG